MSCSIECTVQVTHEAVLKSMGDAWPNTKTQHVQCMTSDEEIPLENERTHFREQINHRFFFFFYILTCCLSSSFALGKV